jgi:hypothetical protein
MKIIDTRLHELERVLGTEEQVTIIFEDPFGGQDQVIRFHRAGMVLKSPSTGSREINE